MHEKEVAALQEQMKLADVKWANEMRHRSEADHAQLRATIERDVLRQFQAVQLEHGQMRSELRYQSQRVHALVADNARLEKERGAARVELASQRQMGELMSRKLRYYARSLQVRAPLPRRVDTTDSTADAKYDDDG